MWSVSYGFTSLRAGAYDVMLNKVFDVQARDDELGFVTEKWAAQ